MALIHLAYAKINLTLDVGEKRADGYHDIQSVMQTITLHDTLEITQTPDRPGIGLTVTGDEAAGVPADASNIVHRAAVRLQKIASERRMIPDDRSGLLITLHKHIPSQAGLGGGSSDAAVTLKALNKLFGLGLPAPHLQQIGMELGADVPFFLMGGLCLVEGLGERVTPLMPLHPTWKIVIAKPEVGVGTAGAYAALDAQTGRVPGQATEAWKADTPRLGNDFEAVVLPAYPAIRNLYDFLCDAPERASEFPPLMCGSGSAVFCRVTADGDTLVKRIQQEGLGKAWVAQTHGYQHE